MRVEKTGSHASGERRFQAALARLRREQRVQTNEPKRRPGNDRKGLASGWAITVRSEQR
jgi:hypothetical protein